MFEWEEADRFSFEDSDRFEEDSICSWISEPESVVNNWRGWRGQMKVTQNPNANIGLSTNIGVNGFLSAAAHSAAQIQQQNAVLAAQVVAINESIHENFGKSPRPCNDSRLLSLTDLAAREVASSIPFELVESHCNDNSLLYNPSQSRMPDELQLRIAFWSFPEQEEDIRLRISAAKLLRKVLSRGGAASWDLVGWALEDEEVTKDLESISQNIQRNYFTNALKEATDRLGDFTCPGVPEITPESIEQELKDGILTRNSDAFSVDFLLKNVDKQFGYKPKSKEYALFEQIMNNPGVTFTQILDRLMRTGN